MNKAKKLAFDLLTTCDHDKTGYVFKVLTTLPGNKTWTDAAYEARIAIMCGELD